MTPRMLLLVLPLLGLGAGKGTPHRPGELVQKVVHSPGFVEPHTPGSGASGRCR